MCVNHILESGYITFHFYVSLLRSKFRPTYLVILLSTYLIVLLAFCNFVNSYVPCNFVNNFAISVAMDTPLRTLRQHQAKVIRLQRAVRDSEPSCFPGVPQINRRRVCILQTARLQGLCPTQLPTLIRLRPCHTVIACKCEAKKG